MIWNKLRKIDYVILGLIALVIAVGISPQL